MHMLGNGVLTVRLHSVAHSFDYSMANTLFLLVVSTKMKEHTFSVKNKKLNEHSTAPKLNFGTEKLK